jgi:ribonucleoside-triphosphate reductase
MSPSLVDLHISSQVSEEYALKNLYSERVAEHHKEGYIYLHDLHSVFKPYCNGIDARIFLTDGLRFPHCRSAPAKHFSSAIYQSIAYMFYSQLFFAGAQAMDYYNWFLAPYVYYDKLGYKEIKQILQGFVFQLNQSNRTGAQSTFTNIGMRIQCPSYLKETSNGEPVYVIYAGKKQKDTYVEFEDEARIIYKALMEIMAGGDRDGAPFTFPLITTAITKDLDWNDELIDITMETASKTGAPYFFNLATDYFDEKYVHAMCCRLLVEHAGEYGWQEV